MRMIWLEDVGFVQISLQIFHSYWEPSNLPVIILSESLSFEYLTMWICAVFDMISSFPLNIRVLPRLSFFSFWVDIQFSFWFVSKSKLPFFSCFPDYSPDENLG